MAAWLRRRCCQWASRSSGNGLAQTQILLDDLWGRAIRRRAEASATPRIRAQDARPSDAFGAALRASRTRGSCPPYQHALEHVASPAARARVTPRFPHRSRPHRPRDCAGLIGCLCYRIVRTIPCPELRSHGPSHPHRDRRAARRGGNPVPMPVSTWVEVDLDRFASNLRAVRERMAQGSGEAPAGAPGAAAASAPEIVLVVKADAYGHGAVEMAEAAEREGVSQFGVATLHEGIQLRQAGCRLPVVVLSPLLPSEIAEAVAHRLDPTVCDLGFAEALSAAAQSSGRPLRFHVEVDTGMGRIGAREEQAEGFLEPATSLPGLRRASVYTHFP